MALVAKGSKSYRKQGTTNQRAAFSTYRKVVFAHEAVGGETSISLSSLITPSSMASNGFVQPSVAELLHADILKNRRNLSLYTVFGGVAATLMPDYAGYTVTSNNTISLVSSLEPGDVLVGVIDNSLFSGTGVDHLMTRIGYIERSRPMTANGPVYSPFDRIMVDTSGGDFTIDLPSNPSLGDTVTFQDGGHSLRAEPLTVARSGQLIMGASSDYIMASNGMSAVFTWVGGSLGWSVLAINRENIYQPASYPLTLTAGNNGDTILVTTTSARTITLPASPVDGYKLTIIDVTGTAGTYAITLARNGANIGGLAADYLCEANFGVWELMAYGGNWILLRG